MRNGSSCGVAGDAVPVASSALLSERELQLPRVPLWGVTARSIHDRPPGHLGLRISRPSKSAELSVTVPTLVPHAKLWSQGAFEESWACRMPCPTSPPLLDGTKLAASAQPEAIYRARQSTALAGKIVIRVKHVEPAAPTAPVPVVLAAADVAVAD